VVLVHGAFADSSSWAGVIERLHAKGVPVVAAANPLRGISIDSQYVANVFALITNAATNAPNVVGLVFVAAFAPDQGEKLIEITGTSKDSVLGTALVPRPYPTATGTGTEFFIDPAKARDAFAGDLTDAQATVIGTIQRPVADLGFGEPTGVPAWKSLPSWAVVATKDRAAGTDLVRAHAERAGATITEVEGSHVIMVSQPDAVTSVIEAAMAKLA
jgi:pimeloyl-ACP methyl ester carboxylesterase